MEDRSSVKLYSSDLLALSLELANVPLDPACSYQGYAKSRTCGSEVSVSFECSAKSGVEDIGLQVKACAVGQASAAIFADAIRGKTQTDIAQILADLDNWLLGTASSSFLPRLELLENARHYHARHDAILLPWRAAMQALSSDESTG